LIYEPDVCDPEKDIDLEPHKWTSDDKRPKPREPFFGDCFWPFVGELIFGGLVYWALSAIFP